MIDLQQIPFSEDAIKQIEQSEINYKRFAGIEFSISRFMGTNHFSVTISQPSPPAGKELTTEELTSRAWDIFRDITPDGFELRVIAETK